MDFKQRDIDQFFKKPDKNIRCVVLFGSNEGMIADLAQKFALTVCNDLDDAFLVSTFQMDALEKDFGLLFGEYNAASLIGGRRIVFVKNANNNLTKPLKELFSESSSDTMLIISSTSLNTKSSLISYLKDEDFAAVVGCYDDREENISSVVRAFFVENGITIAPDAMELLCQRLSADRKASEGELEKLKIYIGSRKNVTPDDVVKAVSDTSNSSTEDFCFYVASGQMQKAIKSYQGMLNEGKEATTLLRALTYHFLKILECIAKVEEGSTVESATSGLRPPLMWFRKSEFLMQVKMWKKTAVFDVLALLYKAELDCKTTGFPADEIGSWTIMQVTGAARKMKAAA